MSGRQRRRGWHQALAALCLLVMVAGVSAHRGHGFWTEMTWVEGQFEIVHRMHLADAIAVLSQLDTDAPIDSLRGRAQLAIYVERHFVITQKGKPASGLETIGAEIEDDFLLVYQEWVTALPKEKPQITNRALLEIEPSAQHFLRYDVGQAVITEQIITE